VAIARALVRDDALVLLADECFSNLDAQLRYQLRQDFRRWQRDRGLTCIFVTHDQEEALALGDRVAVMNEGCIEQVGSPDDLYYAPATIFCARFLGRPPVNLVPLRTDDGNLTAVGRYFIDSNPGAAACTAITRDILIAFRAEDVEVTLDNTSGLRALVEWIEPMHPDTLVRLDLDGLGIFARVRSHGGLRSSTRVTVNIASSAWQIFDRRTGRRHDNRA
jgi:ABC-type sugar transport system ATPase subunit